MKNSATSSLSSGSTSTAGYTQVWSGSFPNNMSSGWAKLNLGVPFAYDGTNLHVLVVKGYQTYTGSYPRYRYSYTASKFRMHRSDSYAWSSSTYMYGYSYRPNIQFEKSAASVTCLSEYAGPTISAFPHNTGFESTSYDWKQCLVDDINWTRDANGTPSYNTGPSSAPEGSYYMFNQFL
jgi:hypothetical protein